jgi:rhamnosyltransferase
MPAHASIIIPTKNAGARFDQVLKAIIKNRVDFDYEVIIVDSGSTDNTKDITKNFPVKLIEIGPLSFSHGGSRNIGAEDAQGEILVFLSQDSIPKDEMWLANLLKGFDDTEVAGIFGRQIPNTDASGMEKFFLEYTYPDSRVIKDSINPDHCTLQDMFFSNVNSAIRKTFWENNKFREDLIMSEDQAWAKDVLIKKKKIIYEPKAAVYHSHRYGVIRAIMRNFDSGLSLKGLVKTSFKTGILYELKYIKSASLYFFKNRLYRYLFMFPFYESLKVLGFFMGRYSQFLPVLLKESISENKIYWAQKKKNISGIKNFKRYYVQLLKNTFVRNKLEFLIFFVTSHCNCRCSTCFYWQSLNESKDLSVEEIRKISGSIGVFRTLLLSGGEPFLRDDLFEVCRIFIEENKISVLSVPTNGILNEKILQFSERILKAYPALVLSISVSIDGFRELHDSIRGADGVFDKVIKTLNELLSLKNRYKNLEIIVNTVITNRNISRLEDFMDFIFANFDVEQHEFELLRGDYKDKNLSVPLLKEIRRIHRLIIKNQRRYLKRRKANPLEYLAVISLLKLSQELKERSLAEKRPLFVCSAGKNIAVLDANGDLRLCELLPAVGNIRDTHYDFSAALNSKQAQELKRSIKETHCNCTHVCFIKLTVSRYFRTLFYMAYFYLRL